MSHTSAKRAPNFRTLQFASLVSVLKTSRRKSKPVRCSCVIAHRRPRGVASWSRGRKQRRSGRPWRNRQVVMEGVKCRGVRMGQKQAREKRAMTVRPCPGDVYAIVGHLDAFGCDGCRYIGRAMQFLLG